MIDFLARSWQLLCEDKLVFRVMAFNVGTVFAAIPVVAFVTGTAFTVNDGAFYILLGLLLAAGTYFIYVAVFGSDKQVTPHPTDAPLLITDLWAILALLTLSIPITLLIKRWRSSAMP